MEEMEGCEVGVLGPLRVRAGPAEVQVAAPRKTFAPLVVGVGFEHERAAATACTEVAT